MSYLIEHTRLGFCIVDLVALAVLAAVIAYFAVKRHRLRKEEQELEEDLEELRGGGSA